PVKINAKIGRTMAIFDSMKWRPSGKNGCLLRSRPGQDNPSWLAPSGEARPSCRKSDGVAWAMTNDPRRFCRDRGLRTMDARNCKIRSQRHECRNAYPAIRRRAECLQECRPHATDRHSWYKAA